MIGVFSTSALLRRELRSTLRSWKTIAWVAFFLGVCAATCIIAWPGAGVAFREAGSACAMVVLAISVLLMLSAILFVSAQAAASMATERENDTLDLLRTSLLRPRQIIIAKLLASVAVFLLSVFAVFPVVAVVLFGVGLDLNLLGGVLLLLTATAVTSGAIGIVCALIFRKPAVAIAVAVVITMLLLMPSEALPALFSVLYMFDAEYFMWGFRGLSPYPVAVSSALVSLFASYTGVAGLTWCLVWQAVLVLGSLFLSRLLFLRQSAVTAVSTEKPIDDAAVLRQRRRTFPYYLIDPLQRKKPIEDGRNPVTVRELRWSGYGSSSLAARFGMISFGFCVLFGLAVATVFQERGVVCSWFITVMVFLAVTIPGVAVSRFTSEFGNGGIDSLRLSLLSAETIVRGKFLSAGLYAVAVWCAAAVATLPVMVIYRRDFDVIFAGLASLAVCGLVAISVAAWASALTRRTMSGQIVAVLLCLTVLFGGAFWAALGVTQGGRYGEAPPFISSEMRAFFSPPAALRVAALDGTNENDFAGVYWTGSLVFFLGTAYLIWRRGVKRFRRLLEAGE